MLQGGHRFRDCQNLSEKASISIGENNRYGHPKDRILEMLDDADIEVYRMDKGGNIIVRSNGKTIEVETEK